MNDDSGRVSIDEDKIKRAREAQTPELNCHVDFYPGGMRFSYSGKANELFQKGANVAIDQLWDKLALIFMDDKWRKKWKVRNAKEFFRTYKPKDVFDEVR